MKYKQIREAAYAQWITGTNRKRVSESDDISSSYECDWQRKFKTPEDASDDHHSVFCSIGEWNTIITDYLTDERWDDLDYANEEDRDVIFRQYTKLLLAVSEILTDFQDALSTFREGKILDTRDLKNNNNTSRGQLEKYAGENAIFNAFEFINNVCKHKLTKFHMCNHHLHIYFADSGLPAPTNETITITNLSQYLGRTATKTPETVMMPKLEYFITLLLDGYRILDEQFRGDSTKFEAFCGLYKGQSCRAS